MKESRGIAFLLFLTEAEAQNCVSSFNNTQVIITVSFLFDPSQSPMRYWYELKWLRAVEEILDINYAEIFQESKELPIFFLKISIALVFLFIMRDKNNDQFTGKLTRILMRLKIYLPKSRDHPVYSQQWFVSLFQFVKSLKFFFADRRTDHTRKHCHW